MKLEYLLYLTEKLRMNDEKLRFTNCQLNCFDDVIQKAKQQLDNISVKYSSYKEWEKGL